MSARVPALSHPPSSTLVVLDCDRVPAEKNTLTNRVLCTQGYGRDVGTKETLIVRCQKKDHGKDTWLIFQEPIGLIIY